MDNWLIILLVSIVALLFFVVAMSLTLIFKGRNIDSEIATNRHMKERGITCAVHDAVSEKRSVPSLCDEVTSCDTGSCGVCPDPGNK